MAADTENIFKILVGEYYMSVCNVAYANLRHVLHVQCTYLVYIYTCTCIYMYMLIIHPHVQSAYEC